MWVTGALHPSQSKQRSNSHHDTHPNHFHNTPHQDMELDAEEMMYTGHPAGAWNHSDWSFI